VLKKTCLRSRDRFDSIQRHTVCAMTRGQASKKFVLRPNMASPRIRLRIILESRQHPDIHSSSYVSLLGYGSSNLRSVKELSDIVYMPSFIPLRLRANILHSLSHRKIPERCTTGGPAPGRISQGAKRQHVPQLRCQSDSNFHQPICLSAA
jgi:hypothetical protein